MGYGTVEWNVLSAVGCGAVEWNVLSGEVEQNRECSGLRYS